MRSDSCIPKDDCGLGQDFNNCTILWKLWNILLPLPCKHQTSSDENWWGRKMHSNFDKNHNFLTVLNVWRHKRNFCGLTSCNIVLRILSSGNTHPGAPGTWGPGTVAARARQNPWGVLKFAPVHLGTTRWFLIFSGRRVFFLKQAVVSLSCAIGRLGLINATIYLVVASAQACLLAKVQSSRYFGVRKIERAKLKLLKQGNHVLSTWRYMQVPHRIDEDRRTFHSHSAHPTKSQVQHVAIVKRSKTIDSLSTKRYIFQKRNVTPNPNPNQKEQPIQYLQFATPPKLPSVIGCFFLGFVLFLNLRLVLKLSTDHVLPHLVFTQWDVLQEDVDLTRRRETVDSRVMLVQGDFQQVVHPPLGDHPVHRLCAGGRMRKSGNQLPVCCIFFTQIFQEIAEEFSAQQRSVKGTCQAKSDNPVLSAHFFKLFETVGNPRA